MPEKTQAPICLGLEMQRPARVPVTLAERFAQPDWVLVMTDIRAEVRVWDDGRWEWLHSSGAREDGGKAPEGPLTAAARAQEAILRRARDITGMVESVSVVSMAGNIVAHTVPRPFKKSKAR